MKKKRKKSIEHTKSIPEATRDRIFIALLFILSLIYFAALLSGAKMMYGSDWLLSIYSGGKWVEECIKQYGKAPLWDPNIFGGLPAGNPYSLYTLLNIILPVHLAWTYRFVLAIFLAGSGMYLFLRELKISSYPALVASIAYMGAGPLLSMPYAGHLSKTMAAALFPFILFFLHKGLTKHRLIYFLFAGAIGGFSATHAHFQLTYYGGWVCAFYLLCHLIWQGRENRLKGSLRLIIYSIFGVILAAGLAAINYLPIFAGLTWGSRGGITRGYEYATSWSLPFSELLDLLTPHFSGLLNNYWGENYFKLDSQYLGILPFLLAFIAIAVKYREKYVRFFIGLGIVTTVFALGGHTPFYRLPYHLLPYLKKFRGPSMAFYLVAFSVIVLAAFGIEALIENQNSKVKKGKSVRKLTTYLAIIFGVVVVFTFICLGAKDSMLAMLKSHFQPMIQAEYGSQLAQQKISNLHQNYPYFLRGLGKALFLIAINSVLIILLAMKKLKLGTWTLIVIPLLIFDQWTVDKQFLKIVPHPREYFASDNIVNFLKKDRRIYRVFPLQYEHTTDSYLKLHKIQSVGGYVSNPYHRYQDLIGAGTSVMFKAPNLVRYRNILDILNVKYIINMWLPEDLSKYDQKTQQIIRNLKLNFIRHWGISWEDAHKGLKLVYRDRHGRAVYENKDVLPRAWIVPDYEVIDKEKALERMKGPDLQPDKTVILEENPGVIHPDAFVNPGRVNVISYQPNKIVCEADLTSPGFLVLSENWHPNWKAYVDGVRTKLHIADYTLRAVWLEKGQHKVEFVFSSPYLKLGATISLLSFLFVLGTVIYWLMSCRKLTTKR